MPSLVTLVMFFAQCFDLATAIADCSLPPSLWCTEVEVARSCGVEAQCLHWELSARTTTMDRASDSPPKVSKNKKPVNLTLVYESYCPGCRNFITTQLWPTYQVLKDYLLVDLLPFGNADEFYNAKSGRWIFECQHGPMECQGNLIETCAIYVTGKDEARFLPFIVCLESSDPVSDGQKCAKQSGLDWKRIADCVNGTEGNIYQHAVALDTPQSHEYVPWIIFNGVHSEKIEQKALNNLKQLVCDSIPYPRPTTCVEDNHATDHQRCFNYHDSKTVQ